MDTPRILLDSGAGGFCNMGDVAMLQVAVRRLQELWPGAQITIGTSETAKLARLCPGVRTVSPQGRHLFLSNGSLMGTALSHRLPGRERALRMRRPALAAKLATAKKRLARRPTASMNAYVRELELCDLAVATGGGYLNDDFSGLAYGVLEQGALAQRLGKPFVLVGQGIGPLTDPALIQLARPILSGAATIFLREGQFAPAILQNLGVASSRIHVTGDDAIELAYARRPAALGAGLGLNFRQAAFAGTDAGKEAGKESGTDAESAAGEGAADPLFGALGEAMQRAAARHHAPLVPLPISYCADGRDPAVIGSLIARQTRPDLSAPYQPEFHDPLEVIEASARCRVVVTGAYHAGVFALAQGASVVALSKSTYYDEKFGGLNAQFGGGCEIVSLAAADFPARLHDAIDRAWQGAPAARPQLLEAAQRQIQSGRAAYQTLRDLIPN